MRIIYKKFCSARQGGADSVSRAFVRVLRGRPCAEMQPRNFFTNEHLKRTVAVTSEMLMLPV